MGYEHSYRGRQCGFNKKHQSTKVSHHVWGTNTRIGGDNVGLIKSTKAPKFLAPKQRLFCICFLRKGEVLAYVRRIHNKKDLKHHTRTAKGSSPRTLCTGGLDPRDLETALFLHILSTEGRGVVLCLEHSKPKGPPGRSKGRSWVFASASSI